MARTPYLPQLALLWLRHNEEQLPPNRRRGSNRAAEEIGRRPVAEEVRTRKSRTKRLISGHRPKLGCTDDNLDKKVSMPRSCIFLLTNPAAELMIDRKNVNLLPILGDYARGQLMLQRIRSYIVVHFKGSRKRLMLESWNYYNKTSSIPDMLCLILRSGRTKYDF